MEDWDLHAVVRGCTTATARPSSDATSATSLNISNDFWGFELGNMFPISSPDPFEKTTTATVTAMEELHELCKPFFIKKSQSQPPQPPLSPQSIFSSPISPLSSVSPVSTDHHHHHQLHIQSQTLFKPQPRLSSSTTTTTTPRSKRKKNQMKKVCQVPAEALSSDVWAWRKYGQKPIKGSPYPRGYYRCSSSKGCMARKQVERNRSDPGMFIVTYTSDHNHPAPTHRNSLAGSTRQKSSTPQNVTPGDDSNKPQTSNPDGSPANSIDEEVVPQTQSKEDDKEMMLEDDDDAVSDDFFEGLEGLDSPVSGGGGGDCLSSSPFAASFGFPWLSTASTGV